MTDVLALRDALRRRFTHDLNALGRGDLHHEAVQDIQSDVFLAMGAEAGSNQALAREVLYDVIGFGPLMPLMTDPAVTEIMVNGPTSVFAERHGRKEAAVVAFESPRHLRYIVQRLMHLSPGKRLDESSPMVDLSLPDGSRVNIVVPPAALGGPQITIRKWSDDYRAMEHLLANGTLDPRMAAFLAAAVFARKTVLISGAAGSGKTTLAQVLGRSFPETDRVVVIEDTYELHFDQADQVRLLTREPNVEGAGGIDVRQLFRNSLRMRPDRIILGEIRGEEAFDFLQAVTSGHRGSIGIIHASSPVEAVYRLENLAAQSGLPVPMSVVRQQVAHGIDLIVQIEKGPDGHRRITSIAEVGEVGEDGEIALAEVFRFVPEGLDAGRLVGRFLPTGVVPAMSRELNLAGARVDPSLFTP